jgi:hypothetical protein
MRTNLRHCQSVASRNHHQLFLSKVPIPTMRRTCIANDRQRGHDGTSDIVPLGVYRDVLDVLVAAA